MNDFGYGSGIGDAIAKTVSGGYASENRTSGLAGQSQPTFSMAEKLSAVSRDTAFEIANRLEALLNRARGERDRNGAAAPGVSPAPGAIGNLVMQLAATQTAQQRSIALLNEFESLL